MYKKTNYNYKDLDRALKTKKKRLYNRIYKMLCDNEIVYFLTLTFTDAIINSTSAKTRERYIKDFLEIQTSEYILNCDYGKTNEREHYHAVVIPSYKMIDFSAYKYGKIEAKNIKAKWRFVRYNNNYEIVAENLTNHAIKSTTKESKIIYSRKHRKPTDKQHILNVINYIKKAELKRTSNYYTDIE